MQALRWHSAGQLRLDDVPEPGSPGTGEALVEVAYCGICGTDVHEYQSGPHIIRSGKHPLTGAEPPVTLGHEFSGRVVAIGSGGPDIPPGTRVAVDPCWRCGKCRSCRSGQYQVCDLGGSVGLASPGGFARYALVPAEGLAVVPDGVPLELAALAEPLSVGLHAVRQGEISPGDTVAVIGAGPIGAASVLAARAAGAVQVMVAEPVPERRELLMCLGATATFDPAEYPVHRAVRQATGGDGADVVIETSGAAGSLQTALKSTRRRGTVVIPALGNADYELDGRQVVLYERRLIGSLGYNRDLPRVLDLIATGAISPEPMISGIFGLADGPRVFEEMASRAGGHFKPLVRVSEDS